ncbi:MAG: PAS domain-containing protein [Proteobacteria bacterium]|nr:PAS domain-containing protein [Pseudomonadota bacterium]
MPVDKAKPKEPAKPGSSQGQPKKTVSKAAVEKAAQKAKPAKKAPSPAARKPGKDSAVPKDDRFPILGLGASAGGLEAFQQFFAAMPPDSGMAFLVVVHLDPDHASILPELIQKHTAMKVESAKDQTEIRPNQVYVAPPNKDLALLKGRILLLDPESPRGRRLPIDFFFRQLAQDQGEEAGCIIFSGTASDGSLGLRDIKGAGGLVVAQEPSSAKYDGMPSSAMATGMVDLVLPPEEMPQKLMYYFSQPHALDMLAKKASPAAPRQAPLQKVLVLLRDRVGHDFSCYKQSTIIRRIERRMSIQQISGVNKYLRFVRDNPEELDALFKDLLIGVTNFFRDPEAFKVLREKMIPKLLDNLEPKQALRVWVPGCSTGEEVYSLVIIIKECLAKAGRDVALQVFGTDIDNVAVDKAREGLFFASIAADVSPGRLQRFFNQEPGAYRVKKELRDPVVFSVQDVMKDPPFSKLDLLSCRNLLIYLDGAAQKKLLALFHYTLKPQGILFLGSSESIGGFADLFQARDKKWKIYSRKPASAAAGRFFDFPTGPVTGARTEGKAALAAPVAGEADLARETRNLVLSEFAPATVIVDQKGEVVYIHGHTGKFLELAVGRASHKISAMAREGLGLELAAALRRAQTSGQEAHSPGVKVKVNGGYQYVDLTVKPIDQPGAMRGLLAVVLREAEAPATGAKDKSRGGSGSDADNRLAKLEQELRHTRERHQSAMEELETSNEELKSINEEMQSANEELQSTNEELEATKEEQQSLNEELATVNTELQAKIDELGQMQDDLKNLLAGTEIATVFLGNNLTVRSFTPAATKLINLIAGDVGRPVEHIVTNLDYPDLVNDAKEVLTTLTIKESEVRTKDGAWYQMRILPYRTAGNVIDGVVITFTDIDQQKKAQIQLRELNDALEKAGIARDKLFAQRTDERDNAREKLRLEADHRLGADRWVEAVFQSLDQAMLFISLDKKVLACNPAAEKLLGYSADELVGGPVEKLHVDREHYQKFAAKIDRAFSLGKPARLQFKLKKKSGQVFPTRHTVSLVKDHDGQPAGMVIIVRKQSVIKKERVGNRP